MRTDIKKVVFMAKTVTKSETGYEEVFVPKNSRDDDSLFISVNGKRILVQKGVSVKIPKAHAEVYKNSLAQTAKNDEFIAANATK